MAVNANVPWTLRQAIDRGLEFYPIEITNFGDNGAGADPFNENGVNNTPISDFPVRGIRIAADSVGARCSIIYNPGQTVNVIGRTNPANTIEITPDTPYIGTLTAVLFARCPFDAQYFDTYTTENGVATAAFGTALSPAVWIPPDVKLELLLRGNGISPTKRKPFQLSNLSFTLTGGGTEDLAVVIPCDMRKRGRVMVTCRAGSANGISFRVTGVLMRTSTGLGPFVQESNEAELIASTAVATGAPLGAEVDPVNMQYLLLKVTSAAASFAFDYSFRLED